MKTTLFTAVDSVKWLFFSETVCIGAQNNHLQQNVQVTSSVK